MTTTDKEIRKCKLWIYAYLIPIALNFVVILLFIRVGKIESGLINIFTFLILMFAIFLKKREIDNLKRQQLLDELLSDKK